MRVSLLLAMLLASAATGHAQWAIQDSRTTADLRGIHSIGNGIAWASGTGGTVLRTTDDGATWQPCAVPPDADDLDLRGVQAIDANTAFVMSSNKGYLSRIYKTTDACRTWKLIFTNPDKDGFFNALQITQGQRLDVLADSSRGKFVMFFSADAGTTWFEAGEPGRDAPAEAHIFSASNSSLLYMDPFMFFGTGAGAHTPPQVFRKHCIITSANKSMSLICTVGWVAADVPLGLTGTAAGVLSLAARNVGPAKNGTSQITLVAVGGSNDKAAQSSGTSATSQDSGQTWTLASTLPRGFRSAIAYSSAAQTWITVGSNGTDISTDDGRNWRALKPSPTDAPDADKSWNALSLPFVVGANGRIGRLRANALQ